MLRRLFHDREFRWLLLIFLLSRLLLTGSGLLGRVSLPPGKALVGANLRVNDSKSAPGRLLEPGEHRDTPPILDLWARWDSEWYLLIAARGYDAGLPEAGSPREYQPQDTSGFFPLYPGLISLLRPMFGAVASALLVSNSCLLIALWLLLVLSRELWAQKQGSRVGLGAGLALLVYPFTLFQSAAYSESLYLALSLAAFLAFVRLRDELTAIAGALAVLTRPFGMLLAIPLAVQWWKRKDRRLRALLFLPAFGLAMGLYLLYCYGLFGDALAFMHRQSHWRGPSVFPGFAFLRWFREGPTIHGAATSSIEALVAIALLALLPLAFRKLSPSLAFYYFLGLALPLSSSLWSFGRISSNLFPLYLLFGLIWAEGRLWSRFLFGFSAVLSLIAMFFFGAGWWVG